MARYYTLNEVNELVPEVARAFTRLMQIRSQLKPIYRRLEQQGLAPTRSDFEVDAPNISDEQRRDRAAFKLLLETLNDEIAGIEAMGGSIKDLDTGLVDWLGEHEGRDVWLCWRYGESEVAFWHELTTGFAGRRPVSELRPTLRSKPPVHS
jgi:hypothetical protein